MKITKKIMKCTYCNSSKPRYSSVLIGFIVILSILCCVMCIWCKRSEPEGKAITNDYCYVIAKIDGHDYIIGGLIGKYGSGLTHSESCSCKKRKELNEIN